MVDQLWRCAGKEATGDLERNKSVELELHLYAEGQLGQIWSELAAAQ